MEVITLAAIPAALVGLSGRMVRGRIGARLPQQDIRHGAGAVGCIK